MSKPKGRPPKPKQLEELDFTTFQEDITLFRNYLIDASSKDNSMFNEEDEDPNIPVLSKFLAMETWKQNIFIVYLLNKDKRIKNSIFTFKALADMLQVERAELMRVIRNIKTELQIL